MSAGSADAALRLFLAVDPPPATREALFRWADGWRSRDDGWRWVAADGVHLTLRFYGSTPPERVEPLRGQLAALARAHAPLALEVRGWGVFPGPSRARVLWAGLAGDVAPLAALAAGAEDGARALGFAAEERPFKGHVTLARAREGRRPRLPGTPDREAPPFGPFAVGELVLYRSRLGPGGARYEALGRFPLGGPGGDPHRG